MSEYGLPLQFFGGVAVRNDCRFPRLVYSNKEGYSE